MEEFEKKEMNLEDTLVWLYKLMVIGGFVLLLSFTVFAPRPVIVEKVLDTYSYHPADKSLGYIESVIDSNGNTIDFVTRNRIYREGETVYFRATISIPKDVETACTWSDYIFPSFLCLFGGIQLLSRCVKNKRIRHMDNHEG